jgi:hypothetical protein
MNTLVLHMRTSPLIWVMMIGYTLRLNPDRDQARLIRIQPAVNGLLEFQCAPTFHFYRKIPGEGSRIAREF